MMSVPVVMFEEFFAPQELGWLWQFALERSGAFAPSHVMGMNNEGVEDSNFRRSRVMYDVDLIHPMVAGRIFQYLPLVMHRLQCEPFPVSQVELQVTNSGDGEFFLPHTDTGYGPSQSRTVTFVYFCHREPRAFDGGELRLYDATGVEGDAMQRLEHVIRPTQNAIVFFPSHCLHEVTRVACPSNIFTDGRLTFNGWLHR